MGRRREGSTYGPSKGEGGDGGEEGGDQGLLRALKSHRDGLKDSEARTRELEEDVEGWVRERVAPYKRLAGGVVFTDEIPKSGSGKILRRLLVEQDRRGNDDS